MFEGTEHPENANPVEEARLLLNKLLTAQERKRKEIDEQMAEEARHLTIFRPTTKD